MTARSLIGAEYRVLGVAKVTVATPSTVNLVFAGATADLKVSATTLKSAERLILVLSAQTAGTTSTLTWSVQDADDSGGSIGTPATLVVATTIDVTSATLAGGTADDARVIGVRM